MQSVMVPLGTNAPEFVLPDTISDKLIKFKDLTSDIATVVMFICNHCPFVKHIMPGIVDVARDYLAKDVRFVAISANDVETYPEDSPANMKLYAQKEQFPFPYLYDATQEVAQSYHAACTPDFFIYDGQQTLVYRGQFDDSRPNNHLAVTGESIREVLDKLLSHQPISSQQKPSIGCSIKWK